MGASLLGALLASNPTTRQDDLTPTPRGQPHGTRSSAVSPRRPLRLLQGGCSWEWISDEAKAEAIARLSSDPFAAVEVHALIARLVRGALRRGRDYKEITREDELFELRIETTSPPLRLYFAERVRNGKLVAVGLLLAPKPAGTHDEQRPVQNRDIAEAVARLTTWPNP